jgi:ATP-binding cassette subfamily B protein
MDLNERQKQARSIAIRHYLEQFWIDKKSALSAVVLSAIGSILVFYVPPLVIGKFLQKYSSQSIPDLADITPYLLAFGGFWILGEIFWRLTVHLMIKAEINGMRRLYVNGLNQLLEKDLAFFHENFAGSLTKRTIAYAKSYEGIFDTFIFNVTSNFFPLIFVCFVLWQFSPLLAIGLVFWVILVGLFVAPFIKKRSKMVAVREIASNKLSGYIADIYTNIDAVRTYGREDFELSKHSVNTEDLMKKAKRSWDYNNQRIDVVVSPLYVLTNVFGLILALSIARKTGASIETVFVTFTYYALFTRVMWEFNDIYRRMETAISEATQYTELLLDEPKVTDAARPLPLKVKSGRLEFKDITFQYHENLNSELFEKLNLSIKAGEKVGLVGHSGGGKSTLVKLILRLMDVDEGRILIDGQDISHVKQTELRKYIAYVPQDPVMFHRSVSDNIAYGKLNATPEEILKAAKNSHSTEFVEQLPHKYETLIGERGVKLSGGQRQRLAIARAMIKNAPILLLDEATSALDSESEKLIQDALLKLMKGKTTIVIAHRLSTIQRMNRIIVLEDGKVAEEGSHKELLAKKGVYAELWKHQSGGFLEDYDS